MNLDHRGTHLGGGFDLRGFRINKQGNTNPGIGKPCTGIFHSLLVSPHIQAAFRGQFLASLRYQATIARTIFLGNREHFLGHRHFQVHSRLQYLLQQPDIAFLDMPAIFPQMHGNGISSCMLGQHRGMDGIRITGFPGLAQGRDMVNIHAE